MSWGPAAGRQKTTTLRKSSASPSRGAAVKSGRSRGAIPFSISAPLEADAPDKEDVGKARDGSLQSEEQTQQRRGETMGGARLSPPQTPAPCRSPASPSLCDESPSGAYATLSRLQSKPSVSRLRSGSGFLWPSSNPSSTSAPADQPQIPSPFAASQSRPAANWSEALARTEKLDSYVRRIVFQAGLDYETRPMVVLASCCLPDPKEVDYDALLDRIMDTMDLFVENDYTVIYFAGGGHHRPGWNWIWRAYRRLDRRFRKNLKKLYIVHPTFFTRSLLQFVNTGAYFVSPKFSKKVVQLYTLSALAEHVPLTQIDIPPEVLQWNTRYEKHVTLPSKPTYTNLGKGQAEREGGVDKVFGMDLATLVGEYGESGRVPRVVRDCIEAILGDFDGIRPAQVEGIFRRSPSSALLKTAQESYDRGHPVSLEQYRDPHIPAVLLKVFLRSLPRPVLPANMYGLIQSCPPPPPPSSTAAVEGETGEGQETIEYLRNRLLPAIEPPCAGILLSYVIEMLHKVAQHKDSNKMDAANLATVIAPNLVSSGNAIKDVMICRVEGISSMSQSQVQMGRSGQGRNASISSNSEAGTTLGSILRFCIERYYEIFDQVTFSPQINSVQELVDDLNRKDLQEAGSRSPSTLSKKLPSLYGTPASTSFGLGFFPHHQHQKGESSNSAFSALSQSPSPWGGFGLEEEDLRSGLSITSREGYRTTCGFQRTIGMNSSGSLRLTKARLGSNTNLRGSFTNASGFRISNLTSSPHSSDGAGGGVEVDSLTSQLSGVMLTGANATATFASSASIDVEVADQPTPSFVSSSPVMATNIPQTQQVSASSTINSSPPDSRYSSPTTTPTRRKSIRRELSELAQVEIE